MQCSFSLRSCNLYLLSPFLQMSVESVVANVKDSILHPLNFDGAIFDVEVVVEEIFFGGRLIQVRPGHLQSSV